MLMQALMLTPYVAIASSVILALTIGAVTFAQPLPKAERFAI